MHQLIRDMRGGALEVATVPEPVARPGEVLVANAASVISAGTERMIAEFARKSLLGKARERPDHVRRVLQKMRSEGLIATVRQVLERLDRPMPMGYSSAGVVLACGAGVQELKPGDRVASNGPHAEVVSVPRHLCARVPDGVPFEQAAFAVLGSIALHGVRLSRAALGETAFVIGLGPVGQLTVGLLHAASVRALATDPDPSRCEMARRMGADVAEPDLAAARVMEETRGLGADAVLIAASTGSDGPVRLAGEAVRKKGVVVAIGAVGLSLPRREYYFKEAEFVVSCSYGPGRYDADYEERGLDYPAAYVRWTEQRNIQGVVDLMGAGRLDVSPLITHRFPVERAAEAYDLVERGSEPHMAVVLEYPEAPAEAPKRTVRLSMGRSGRKGAPGAGVLGAGNYARAVMLPLLRRSGLRLRTLCSAGGLSAADAGRKFGFEVAATDEEEVFADPEVDAVFILTRHDLHARQVLKAVKAGKHVFVEKPLCLTVEELGEIEAALAEAADGAPVVMVGFNRRFAQATELVKEHFAKVEEPLTVSVRFNAGDIPAEHWTQDELIGGGRIIGEACHGIDLAGFLAGSPPARVFAESVGGAKAPEVTDDRCFITMRHADGSVSSVAYVAGGDKAFPKERVEVFGGGRAAAMDDYRTVDLASGGRVRRKKLRGMDKGHAAEVKAFARAISEGGDTPIPWRDIRATTLASILAVRSLREGAPFDVA